MMGKGKLFVATETFSVNGYQTITKDVTRVREGHQLLSQFPHLFREADAHYEVDVEAATAEPGRRRGERTVAQ
jgi:hypothetical protein